MFRLWPLFSVLPLLAQDGIPQASATLSISQTSFKAGQPITLIMAISGVPGYRVSSSVYQGTTGPDTFTFTPPEGVTKLPSSPNAGDFVTFETLGAQPFELRLTLNEWFRFDAPGHYSVQVETWRIFQGEPGQPFPSRRLAPIKTNSVEFDIVPMTEEEEVAEIARLKAAARLVDRSHGRAIVDDPQRQLTYLTGPAAARDAIDTAFKSGNFQGVLRFPNRALVLRLLEEGYLRPDTAVGQRMVQDMVALHNPKDQAESARIQLEYLRQLSSALVSKKDRAQIVTAQSIVFLLEKGEHPEIAAPALATIREHLEQANYEPLLRVRWDELKDPSLIPALERILSNPRLQGRGSGAQRIAVLNALFDLAPARCHDFVLAELKNPEGIRDTVLLGRIPEEDLPELDSTLLARIEALAPVAHPGDLSRLSEQAKLLARFASAAILPDVEKLYRNRSASWTPGIEADFVAYLLRRQGEAALPLARTEADRTLREHGSDQDFLGEMAACYYSAPLARLLRERLDGENSRSAGVAGYVLSKYGSADDTALVERRLNRTPDSDTWLKRDLTESVARLRSRFP